MDDGPMRVDLSVDGLDARMQLKDLIERIEGLNAEKKDVAERIKAEYAMAESNGFDKKAIMQIIKDREGDLDKTVTLRRVTDTYVKALGSLAGTPLGDWARQWMATGARQEQYKRDAAEMNEWMKSRSKKEDRDSAGQA